MIIFPATDIISGRAVRLVKGDYDKMTVYGDPLDFALRFQKDGAEYLHAVDLEGARDGGTPNFDTVKEIVEKTTLKVEIGGGVRDMQTVEKYLNAGVYRVIVGTAAVTDPGFLETAVKKYGEKIAVGADIRDGNVSIKGWRSDSGLGVYEFFDRLQALGVKTVICTDISKDGLLSGTNVELYRDLSSKYSVDITASGGVSSLSDITALRDMGLYGAILGKALYTGDLSLSAAIAAANDK
ncbi:MAG: 1-(5-phosphoribosyl)-5-[Clostridia bacterium]|nr:1-(5-phosphoribosyl)-5-[(5-phosphoribosylamino)methylideneamino]imidazole-4-carboxamide isomerase [Clostridia bacterium]